MEIPSMKLFLVEVIGTTWIASTTSKVAEQTFSVKNARKFVTEGQLHCFILNDAVGSLITAFL